MDEHEYMDTVNKTTVVSFIIDKVNELTKYKYDDVRGDTHLASVGIDSLFAVLICGFIEDKYGIEVEPVLMFEYKNANEVADAVLRMIEEQRE
jgi:acyl carrier protein